MKIFKTLLAITACLFVAGQVITTPAHATATYQAITDITIYASANRPIGDPTVTATAIATNFDLNVQANGIASATAYQSGASGDPVDLLSQSLRLEAGAFGWAEDGDASSQSFNDVVITLHNSGNDIVAIMLFFEWTQSVDASTQFPGDIASAGSDLLFTDDLSNMILVDSLISAIAANGTASSDAAGNSFSYAYLLGGNESVGIFGFADAFGNALGVNPVPEPSTFVLLGAGLVGLAAVGIRRKKS